MITEAWAKINNKFASAGIQPHTYIIDNEFSNHLKAALAKKHIAHQLVPPYYHISNLSERAIQIFKNHLKAGLAIIDPEYPASEWDRLVPQIEVTLNLLKSTRLSPWLSVFAYILGQFDLPGTKVLAHLKPGQQSMWALHGEQRWTTGATP